MNISTAFVRVFFVFISIIFMIAYASGFTPDPSPWTYLWGTILGCLIGGALVGFDLIFKRFTLRSFNIAVLGLFMGYLMGTALVLILNAILQITARTPPAEFVEFIKIFLFLFGTYLGVIMTLRASNQIYVSFPFVKFSPTAQKTKDILLDHSALSDVRIIDLAGTGLLDNRLVLPRFVLREFQEQEEAADETERVRAKRAVEAVRKLEMLPSLNLRYQDTTFPEIKETSEKILRLARLLDADVISSDFNRVQMSQLEGIRVINISSLSNALKPIMQRGEYLNIKIQRHGKDELQGVGYLEDGTMVVVNGAGNSIGETISARVLSVKHTTSGRMIFCNLSHESSENNA